MENNMIEVHAKAAYHTKSMSEQKIIINQHQFRSTSYGNHIKNYGISFT